jgi:biopolymer transport protein ExbD
MHKRPILRRALDLTPLLDVIMILLFGAMINSVELAKAARTPHESSTSATLSVDVETLMTRSRELEQALEQAKRAETAFRERLVGEKNAANNTLVRILGLSEQDRKNLEERLRALAAAQPEDVAKALASIDESVADRSVLLAVRRIQEMQKVFTFVDLHIDADDFLSIRSDSQSLGRVPVRDRRPSEVAGDLRQSLEAVRMSEVVLLLFSYDGRSRDRSVETAEIAINELLDTYRKEESHRGRQFRYGRVGLLSESP